MEEIKVCQDTQVCPTTEEIASLDSFERFAFQVADLTNRGLIKRFFAFLQRYLGATWIHLVTYNVISVYGFENVKKLSFERPVILVANHRSFFDMYVVSSYLLRHIRRPFRLFFPVRGKFFYQTISGMLINLIMGWWSMYPPFFSTPEKRIFDKYALRRLVELCCRNERSVSHIIGFHPEGRRNLDENPYSYLPPQPGVGRIIHKSAPVVVPVFITGLSNNIFKQAVNNWRTKDPIRIHFGAPLEMTTFLARPNHLRTYKEIADFVMSKIAELGENDRRLQQAPQ